MQVMPLRNYLLVQLLAPKQQTASGLVMVRDPRLARFATVLKVGPQVRDVREGATVVVNSISGMAVGDQLLVPESAVLGTL